MTSDAKPAPSRKAPWLAPYRKTWPKGDDPAPWRKSWPKADERTPVVNGPAVTVAMLACGLNAAQLASMASVDVSDIVALEAGLGAPPAVVDRVASALRCDVGTLYLSRAIVPTWWRHALRACALPIIDTAPRRVNWRLLEAWRGDMRAAQVAARLRGKLDGWVYFAAERGESVSLPDIYRLAYALRIPPAELLNVNGAP